MFKFNVNMTEQDYIDFNKFCLIRSPYGRRAIKNLRIIITVCALLIIVLSLFGSDSVTIDEGLIGIIPGIIFFVLFQIALVPFFKWTVKPSLSMQKKSGKLCYSPSSVIEFNEDSFTETTPENKTEQKYSAVERVDAVDNRNIYIFVNNIIAYTIPFACFENEEQYKQLLEFLKEKGCQIIYY